MADNTKAIEPPKRMRTGEFDEPFAREANKRRQERQSTSLVPPLQSAMASQKSRRRAWYRWGSGNPMDEDLESREGSRVSHNVLPVNPSVRRGN